MKKIRILILIILIALMFFVLKDIYKEDNIRLVKANEVNSDNGNFIVPEGIKNQEDFDDYENIETMEKIKEKIPEDILGYEIDGILKIPKIKLETYIFKEYSEEAMNIAPTKLWGPNINESGNYSIIRA